MQGAVMMQGEVPTQRSMAVPELLQALRQRCGADAVAVDEPARRLAAHDVFVALQEIEWVNLSCFRAEATCR